MPDLQCIHRFIYPKTNFIYINIIVPNYTNNQKTTNQWITFLLSIVHYSEYKNFCAKLSLCKFRVWEF